MSSPLSKLRRGIYKPRGVCSRGDLNSRPRENEKTRLFGLWLFGSQHTLHGGANWLISAMNTSIPTARSPHSLFEFRPHPFDVFRSGCQLLTEITQHIHSLRARGVRPFHIASASGSEDSVFGDLMARYAQRQWRLFLQSHYSRLRTTMAKTHEPPLYRQRSWRG